MRFASLVTRVLVSAVNSANADSGINGVEERGAGVSEGGAYRGAFHSSYTPSSHPDGRVSQTKQGLSDADHQVALLITQSNAQEAVSSYLNQRDEC